MVATREYYTQVIVVDRLSLQARNVGIKCKNLYIVRLFQFYLELCSTIKSVKHFCRMLYG